MRAGEQLVGMQEMGGARRGLYKGEQERPGRSELTYMQHKYTPLDTRIIIITAAILLLLLSILFLNFFIRWALRRFFLLHSQQKPINPNKGLSKRQVQALPSFTYSSSKPPIFAASYPSPQFYHDLIPITSCHGGDNFDHTLKPISSHSCCHDLLPTKIGSPQVNDIPTEIGSPQVDDCHPHPPTKSKIDDLDYNLPSQLGSTKVDEVINEKFGSREAHEVIEGNNPPMKGDEVAANEANSIIGCTKDDDLSIDSEAKATFKGGNPIIGRCNKAEEGSNNGENNASSPTPCPICLVDYVDGDTIRVLPTCRHYFHVGCIDMWLSKSSSCPACRANILEATRIPINPKPTLQVQLIITTSSH